MCKPASEVGRVRPIESNSTRARAMLLWQIVEGYEEWTERSTELLFQATLDGISESWCVVDRPVTQYQLAARRDVWDAGLAPKPVRRAVSRAVAPRSRGEGRTVLFAAELAEIDDPQGAESASELLGADMVFALSGATAYCLGATDVAKQQAREAAALMVGASVVVADGPQTQWMIERIWPELGVSVDAKIVSLSRRIDDRLDQDAVVPIAQAGERSFFLDSRAASYLASRLAIPRAVDPSFSGPEEDLGLGESYEEPRRLAARLDIDLVFDRWSRSLARSCGSDDALWATYPDIAEDLARDTVNRSLDLCVAQILVDSPIAARRLLEAADGSLGVAWVGDLVRLKEA